MRSPRRSGPLRCGIPRAFDAFWECGVGLVRGGVGEGRPWFYNYLGRGREKVFLDGWKCG